MMLFDRIARNIRWFLICTILLPALPAVSATITLQWDAVSDPNVNGYHLFSRLDGQSYNYQTPTWQGSVARCTLSNLADNTWHFFVVRAVDGNGNESGDSNEVRYIRDARPPDTPSAVPPADAGLPGPLTPNLFASAFSDPDSGDTHYQSQWRIYRSGDNSCVLDITSGDYLTDLPVPAMVLDENDDYYWRVRYRSQALGLSGWSSPSYFSTGMWADDSDADGIPDGQRAPDQTDLDNDGTPDKDQATIKSIRHPNIDRLTGLSIQNAGNGVTIRAIMSPDPIDLPPSAAVSVVSDEALFAFKLGLNRAGETVTVRLVFSNSIGSDRQLAVLDWQNGFQGYGANSWFTSDRQSLNVQLTDGGSGDLDGRANGAILTTATFISATGLGAIDSANSGTGGGGGGCFISSLAP